jgi:hypothetical protein
MTAVADLGTVAFKEVIEVFESFPLLISGRRQDTVAGVAVKDVGFLIIRHGLR